MKAGFDRLLCLLGALGAVGAAALLRYRMVQLDAPQWAVPSVVLAVIGILALGATIKKGGWYQRMVAGFMKLGLTTGITFGIAETACRALDLDFNEVLGVRRANEAFPIYFRLPTHPSGSVFFTRTPGATWTGKPLQTLLKNHRCTDVAYTDEPEVAISYDHQGFRNTNGLTDWDIVVAGDSFTESGYLPEPEIFTGIAAAKLGRRIRNLGITDTGNFSHAHYVETYGKAPSCKTTVLAFFEGNDIADNVHDAADIETFRRTGQRPSHDIPKQPSLIKAAWTLLRDFKQLNLREHSYANAFFKSGAQEIPVTIADAPPSSIELKPEEKAALASALDAFVSASQKYGMKPHLLYLPCKRRVLHGHLKQGDDYPNPGWQPGDLPPHIAVECLKRGIDFIDVFPALTAAAAKGKNPYNTIYDTHFNAEGHRIVGEVLAEALK